MTYRQSFLIIPLLLLIFVPPVRAQRPETTERKVENPIGVAEDQARSLRRVKPNQVSIVAEVSPAASETVDITADGQEAQGDVVIATGNVQVVYGDILLIADRANYNRATGDLLAEGNVYFEQQGQRISGDRFEFNARTKLGTIFTATAFTNRTPDGTVVIIDAQRAEKTGEETFALRQAIMTACQEAIPKWSLTARRARIELDERAQVYHALLRIKNFPVFYLPYASISISKKDRSSGFLLPDPRTSRGGRCTSPTIKRWGGAPTSCCGRTFSASAEWGSASISGRGPTRLRASISARSSFSTDSSARRARTRAAAASMPTPSIISRMASWR